MIDVNVAINGAILNCDESILGLQLGRGYSIVKTYIDDLPFRDKVMNAAGQLQISYLGSVQYDEQGKYLFCLKKDDIFQIQNPFTGSGVYTADDLLCGKQIEPYTDAETDYLYMIFSLLRLFKEGNIGTKEIFFDHNFSWGILNNSLHHTKTNEARNIADNRIFSLNTTELHQCNQFIANHSGAEYILMKDCIGEFIWGLDQLDIATGFEQYTTALEMTLLGHNQQSKKEVLSKRVSVMLESVPSNINHLYNRMKDFYRFRSESLHEGIGQNISNVELFEMEGVVRQVLTKCLERCEAELAINATITWDEIKAKIIQDLKEKVTAENAAGTFTT